MAQATRIGELAVRRWIEINAPPERVWQEFASAERFRLWYTPEGGVEMPCKKLEYEPRTGGRFVTDVLHGEQWIHFEGKVLAYDPPRELTVEMGPFEWTGTTALSVLTFLLHPLPDGRTRAEIVHHGFEVFGDAARNVYEAFEGGWDMTVPTALRNLVETGKGDRMTTLQVMSSLYDYHRWANERLLDAAEKLDEGALAARADIPFGSVQDNMLHILGSQVSWIMRLTGASPRLATVEPGRVAPALRESFGWAHETFASYLGSLSDEDVERETAFVDFEGNAPHNLRRPLWEVLLSVGSHGMTHRAEVAIVLTRLCASPEQMDYSEYAWRRGLRDAPSPAKGARE